MAKWKIALPSFFFFCISIAFLASSLSTEFWIESQPYFEIPNGTIKIESVPSPKGNIHFGLFKGSEFLNQGLQSVQVRPTYIVCDTDHGLCMFSNRKNPDERENDLKNNIKLGIKGLISYGLWISTVVLVSIAITFAVVGAIFSVVNCVMTPVEFITGIRGLYVWNGLGSVFCFGTLIVWAVQYHQSLKNNVLNVSSLFEGWLSVNSTSLSYSFWFILASLIFFLTNMALILVLTLEPWVKKKSNTNENMNAGGIIMLY